VNDPSGIVCGSGSDTVELLWSQNRSVNGHRHYDRDNKLTVRHYQEISSGTITNPLTGAYLSFTAQDTVVHNLAVAGDLTTGTISVSGGFRAFRPQGGAVLIDAGRSLYTAPEDNETIIRQAGPHPFTDYFVLGDASALQPICDALT
jgi:hypothetical protein